MHAECKEKQDQILAKQRARNIPAQCAANYFSDDQSPTLSPLSLRLQGEDA
jgi:hypothetical protein